MRGASPRGSWSAGHESRSSEPPRRRPALQRIGFAAPLLVGSFLLVGVPSSVRHAPLTAGVSYLYPPFGSGGVALLTPSADSSQAYSTTSVPPCPSSGSCPFSGIQGDVVAVGYQGTGSSGGTNFAAAMVNPTTGALVTGWGGGLIVTNFGQPVGSFVQATGVAFYGPCPSAEPSCPWKNEIGDTVVVGTEEAFGSTQENILVYVIKPGGGTAYFVTVEPNGDIAATSPSVALETTGAAPTGDIVIGGSVFVAAGGGQEPLLAALTPAAGALDTTFSGGGEQTNYIEPVAGNAPSAESLSGVSVDSAGDIVAAGTFIDQSGNSDILVARFRNNGNPDTRFGASSTCGTTPTCSGSVTVGATNTAELGAGVALEPVGGTCTGEPGCYNVLVVGTSVPSSGASSEIVAAVTQTGTNSSFGGGLVKVPGSSNGQTGTGISVQVESGSVTGIMVTGYAAGTVSAHGSATVSRISPAGSVVSGFGSSGTYTIPSGTGQDQKAFAITTIPNTLDFMMVGALLGSNDSVTRFALARILGEIIQVTATVTKDNTRLDTDFVNITLHPTAFAPASIAIKYTLTGTGGVTFGPSSGIITLGKGQGVANAEAIAYFPPLIGNQTVTVSTSTASGLSSVTSPVSFSLGAASPFGAAPAPGYWMMTTTGGVYAFNVPFKGALKSLPPSPIVGLAESPTGSGYWLVTTTGGVYSFGVPFKGALTSKPPAPIVAIATDPATGGYWLFGQTGAVYGFDAPLWGANPKVVGSVVSAGAAPDGLGYWIVTNKGAVYGIGPGAKYQGGATNPASPIVSIAPDLHTGGYWLVTAKGAVYAFGAPYLGAATNQNATCIAADPALSGYWISLANGGVYSFGAKFYGSAAPDHPHGSVITILGR